MPNPSGQPLYTFWRASFLDTINHGEDRTGRYSYENAKRSFGKIKTTLVGASRGPKESHLQSDMFSL
jgi:hypothetical protein